jgi:hypothetical protein
VEGDQDRVGESPFTMTTPAPDGLLLCHRTASVIVGATNPHSISSCMAWCPR